MTNFRGMVLAEQTMTPPEIVQVTSIDQIQAIVGGYFAIIEHTFKATHFGDMHISVIGNDEAVLQKLPPNPRIGMLINMPIYGPVIVAGGADRDGETLDCPTPFIEAFMFAHEQIEANRDLKTSRKHADARFN